MKNRFTILIFLLLWLFPQLTLAIQEPCYRLHQRIETKAATASDENYRTVTEVTGTYLSESLLQRIQIQGILVSWGYAVRGENLWIPTRDSNSNLLMEVRNNNLSCILSFEKDDFPMDGNWDVIWRKFHVFKLHDPYIQVSRIQDKDFRITLTWEEASSPVFCENPPWLQEPI